MSVLRVHIEYLDGRPSEDQDMPANFSRGQERAACMQMLADIHQMGVVIFEPSAVTLIPIASIKSVRVEAPSVVVADASSLLAIDAAARAAEAPGRIKL